jgi:hypothetical protein
MQLVKIIPKRSCDFRKLRLGQNTPESKATGTTGIPKPSYKAATPDL